MRQGLLAYVENIERMMNEEILKQMNYDSELLVTLKRRQTLYSGSENNHKWETEAP